MKVSVIGAGSWGTALSQVLAKNGNNVGLWARRPEVVKSINSEHKNPRYLSDVELDPDIVATVSYKDTLLRAKAAVIVTPSTLIRGAGGAMADIGASGFPLLLFFAGTKGRRGILADVVDSDFPVIVCSKGIEEGSGLLPIDILDAEMGNRERFAVLSGPNHAEEVIKGVPAATVIASESPETAAFFQNLFASESFRAYTSDDARGVELCAAFKNVIAIAVGISYGLGFGDNTAALLVSRGLAEMSRLVVACGGKALTCMGLAGTGDMVATCMSHHSRNRTFGEMLAAGKTLDDFTAETHMVAEGANACRNVRVLSERYGVELPLADAVRSVVWEGADPKAIAKALTARSLKPEFYGI